MTVGYDLSQTIKGYFTEAKGKRKGYEDLWLKDLRQYKGIYDPEIKQNMDPKRSQAFIRETRTKVRTVDARVMDLLFPANGEKNWGIRPTPEPEFPPDVEQELIQGLTQAIAQSSIAQYQQQVQQVQQQGGDPNTVPKPTPRSPTEEELEIARLEASKVIASKMENTINDQLTELKYRKLMRDVAHSGHLYGTGFLKGPLVDQTYRKKWTQNTEGQWNIKNVPILKPYIEFKHIWNLYLDMSVTEIENCRYMIERHTLQRHKVMELAKRPDFNGEEITNYLTDHPAGDCNFELFEQELFNLKAFDQVPASSTGKYQVLEFWGYIPVVDLVNSLNDEDKQKPEIIMLQLDEDIIDIFVNAWVLGDSIIKIAQQPIEGVEFIYYPYYFDKDETSIYAEGIPTVMRDPQRLVNASVRGMIDNAAHCAGPQYEVNVDLLDANEDPTETGAFKVWLRTGRDADVAGKEVVRIKQISSYTPEFMQLWGAFSRAGDEVTLIPRYLQGDARVSGAGRTASGLSMLMGQANVGLTDIVRMFDECITKPFISNMYHWNMQFNPDTSIKGDMEIEARGSTALMAKELRAQQIQLFLQMTLNQFDAPWVKRENLLKEWAKSTDIAEVDAVRTPEEHAQIVQSQQEAAKAQQAEEFNMRMQEETMKAKLEMEVNAREQALDTIESAVRNLTGRLKRLEQTVGSTEKEPISSPMTQ
jgi:hypothetical protein